MDEQHPPPRLEMKLAAESRARARKKKAPAKKAGKRGQVAKPARSEQRQAVKQAPPPSVPINPELEARLKAWRLAEAKKHGVPAFRILTDAVLRAIAQRKPATAAELLSISGIGMSTVEKYGARIYQLVAKP